MKANQTEITIHDFQKGYLTLPFNENQFKDFVSSLLGQPQTINKLIEGKFEVHLKDLQNFNDLIDQRITQQNNGKLIQLKTQIFFSDDSSVLLSSLTELETYNEVKPIISRQVILTWSYLIQFSDKLVPEKQEIELKISTNDLKKKYNLIKYYPLLLPMPLEIEELGRFEINVRHTARSWGNDIEALLTNQINSILLKKGRVKQIFDKYTGAFLLLFGLGLSSAGIYSLNIRNSAYLRNSLHAINPIIKNPNINDKVNYLVKLSAEYHSDFLSSEYGFGYFIIVIMSFFIGITVVELVSFNEKSFIVLTRESLKNRDETLTAQKNKISTFVISYSLSIVASIIASIIYAHFSK